jgi:hypothetical protein
MAGSAVTGRWIAGCVAIALVLRLPWLQAPLSIDEGGVALVAGGWDDGGPHPYGRYWLDRPPGLVLLYRLALEAGDLGIRALGAGAAALLVVLVGLLGRRLGGDRTGRFASLFAALLLGSATLNAVFTTAELLAVVPGCCSVLLVVTALQRDGHAPGLFAAAGLLAVTALLVKQSFGDALLAGVAALAVVATHSARAALGPAVAYGTGAAVPLLAMEAWEALSDVSDGAMSYALLGFRIDVLTTFATAEQSPLSRLDRLVAPAVGSGLVLLSFWAVHGLRALARREAVTAAVAAWVVGGLAGVLAGGSYWAHYLLQLVPAASLLAAFGLQRTHASLRMATLATLMFLSVSSAVAGVDLAPRYNAADTAIARAIRASARPGDTVQVLYARANLVYATGLASPFPYQWVAMLQAIPTARAALVHLLDSERRPTWLVQWHHLNAFEMDHDGAISRAVRVGYRRFATVAEKIVWVRRDVERGATPASIRARVASPT